MVLYMGKYGALRGYLRAINRLYFKDWFSSRKNRVGGVKN